MKQEQYNWKFKKMTDDPSFKEWHSNQDNISHSLNTLVSFIIRLIGTGDLGSFDNQTKLQQILLLQDEPFINAVAKRVATCSSSSFSATVQERTDEKPVLQEVPTEYSDQQTQSLEQRSQKVIKEEHSIKNPNLDKYEEVKKNVKRFF
ncbi:hypothetical protein [Bacillus pseudomycoides]|uniref:hypothetical protein n=1 Tax=Bacillus pseudomycoides TaxID=64104 RepID=UPI000503F8B2|nr:hypothetical protein [Bacillus pseudomycoides]KFN13756.1 hypothetical protein DJ94_4480 [Bacillus pseudomycoides]MDR4188030.1 hypothetical protein [Bacillus pseudomycoides]MED0858026.1 hypothetical protein [Bacillus pseudomycoides]PGC41189.1 hypothetical protein COM18_11685 [Bacillus pseudomycoides]